GDDERDAAARRLRGKGRGDTQAEHDNDGFAHRVPLLCPKHRETLGWSAKALAERRSAAPTLDSVTGAKPGIVSIRAGSRHWTPAGAGRAGRFARYAHV